MITSAVNSGYPLDCTMCTWILKLTSNKHSKVTNVLQIPRPSFSSSIGAASRIRMQVDSRILGEYCRLRECVFLKLLILRSRNLEESRNFTMFIWGQVDYPYTVKWVPRIDRVWCQIDYISYFCVRLIIYVHIPLTFTFELYVYVCICKLYA